MSYEIWVGCTEYCSDYEDERRMLTTDSSVEAIDASISFRDNLHYTEIRKVEPIVIENPVVEIKEISVETFATMLGVTPDMVRAVWRRGDDIPETECRSAWKHQIGMAYWCPIHKSTHETDK